ncbi:maltose transport system permease protein MalF [Clostridium tepidiprofundi DSM 19306]|uniref:Maltose/maltodextrin transport system permease protein n=1 Tax=Clostridium tepidiprofundi DSM 19306 TaxID=1121338 RepID=A0A151B5E5_9CLOT|nr:sugar ABC transporter permease [Clostridium tepidiprofundi]KYH35119.1 maltose transport system permease protein MalF [Clostridium tepidiprofundi DSM 19306]
MKRAHKSAALSAVFMGAGQLYNKEILKGCIFAIIELIAILKFNYFTKAIHGLITLGDTPQYFENGISKGDHSIFLLIEGLIALIILIVILTLYIINIVNAYKYGKFIEEGNKPLSTKEAIKASWEKYFPHIMLTPAFLFTIFFILLPIIFTFAVAFTNYSSPNHLPPRHLVDWVGFRNFKNLVKLKIWNNTLLHVGLWTVVFATITTIFNYFGGLVLALLTNAKKIKFKKLWRTIFILPYAIPAFISLLIMRLVFSGPGPVNHLLVTLGLGKVPFFTNAAHAKVMILLINMWLGAPYFMILMAGVLTNIPNSLFEAAEIDGASKWQQFWKITLPMVLFQTMPLLIMTFAYNFNNFGVIYLLTDGNPVNGSFKYAGSTDILISWIYKMTKDQNQFHMAAVVTILLFLIVAGVSTFSFIKTKSFKEEDMM